MYDRDFDQDWWRCCVLSRIGPAPSGSAPGALWTIDAG